MQQGQLPLPSPVYQCTDQKPVVDRLSAATAFRIRPLNLAASEAEEDEFVEAKDLEALQKLFSKYCDKEGLMTKEAVKKIPSIAELLVGFD